MTTLQYILIFTFQTFFSFLPSFLPSSLPLPSLCSIICSQTCLSIYSGAQLCVWCEGVEAVNGLHPQLCEYNNQEMNTNFQHKEAATNLQREIRETIRCFTAWQFLKDLNKVTTWSSNSIPSCTPKRIKNILSTQKYIVHKYSQQHYS